jgi:uncharacterized protein HemY
MENNDLVNEYINRLASNLNDRTMELVLAQSKLNVANKEIESLKAKLEELQKTEEPLDFE